MNMPNRMQSHWSEVARFVKIQWPRLTDVDLEQINGEYDRLVSKITELYRSGSEITQEAQIKGKIQRFLNNIN